jgi:hypothetical protein
MQAMNFISRLVLLFPLATSVRDYPHEKDVLDMYNCVSREELVSYAEKQELDLYKKEQQLIVCFILAFYVFCIVFKVYHDYVVKSLKNTIVSHQNDIEFNRIQIEMLNNAIDKLVSQHNTSVTFVNQDAIIDMKGWEENEEDSEL